MTLKRKALHLQELLHTVLLKPGGITVTVKWNKTYNNNRFAAEWVSEAWGYFTSRELTKSLYDGCGPFVIAFGNPV